MKFVLMNQLDEAGLKLMDEHHIDYFIANTEELWKFPEQLAEADALIIVRGRCQNKVLDMCPKLKAIGIHGVGIDRMDLGYATKKGVAVLNTPGANSVSVAEHTMAFILACAKNLVEQDRECRKGNWGVRMNGKALELAGKTVGIIGVGSIGRLVAGYCRAFGMHTLGYSHSHNRTKVEAAGCEFCDSLDELLRRSDFVSLHMPLTPESRGIIGERELCLMKRSAYLINTSRGAEVDSQALADAVNRGIIAGAAVDVFDPEPATPDNPLFSAPDILCSPHCAAFTKGGKEKMAVAVVSGCLAVCEGKKWDSVVNPEVFK